MRTLKLRTVAVVAGFVGLGMLVAGTASAMISSGVEAPVTTAVLLHQEDPSTQTAPVTAESAAPSAPVEVGSGAIKCEDDGTCAARIKVDPNKGAPPSDSPPANPPATPERSSGQANGSSSDSATSQQDSALTPADQAEVKTDEPARESTDHGDTDTKNQDKKRSDNSDLSSTDGDKPSRDGHTEHERWDARDYEHSAPKWDFDMPDNWKDDWREGWDEGWSDYWREGWEEAWGHEWNPGDQHHRHHGRNKAHH